MYQVLDWEKHFEGAKSKGYKNKTTCQMPTKHGLGYRRLVRTPNGPALFGAWCALIQLLSRHTTPRQGYCTDTGEISGSPLTADDLEVLTDIPAPIFEEMLKLTSDSKIGWIRYHKDTAGDHGIPTVSPQYPLNSDLDLDSNLNSDSRAHTHEEEKREKLGDSVNGFLTKCVECLETKHQVKHRLTPCWLDYFRNDLNELIASGISQYRILFALEWYRDNDYFRTIDSGRALKSAFVDLEKKATETQREEANRNLTGMGGLENRACAVWEPEYAPGEREALLAAKKKKEDEFMKEHLKDMPDFNAPYESLKDKETDNAE